MNAPRRHDHADDLPAIRFRDERWTRRDRKDGYMPDRTATDRHILIALVRALRDELEAAQWVETESGPGQLDLACPSCDGWRPDHRPSCSLAELLARTAEMGA